MTAAVEQAISTLLTLTQSDDQTNVQGVALTHFYDAFARTSQIANFDLQAFRLNLDDDTRAINQLDSLLLEAKSMLALVYSYRSTAKAIPEIPEGPEQIQSDLYREAFRLLDAELNRPRELFRWHTRACRQVASDLGWFWRGTGGPSWSHMWCLVRILDSLLVLDHLKNGKASMLYDLTWHQKTFPTIRRRRIGNEEKDENEEVKGFLSQRWAILQQLKKDLHQTGNSEELVVQLVAFCMENLEGAHTVLWGDRLALLRTLPVLLTLAAPGEKDDGVFRKKIKLERVLRHLRREPVVAAFEEVYIAPAAILPELSLFFRKQLADGKLELPLGGNMDPTEVGKVYGIVPNLPAMQQAHDDICLRLTAVTMQVQLAKEAHVRPPPGSDTKSRFGKEIREAALSAALEGVLLLSKWTGRLAQHFAWKFSHPLSAEAAKAASQSGALRAPEQGPITGYEKAIRYNLTTSEKHAVVTVLEHIQGVGAMLALPGGALEEVLWEGVHGEIQEFVRTTLAGLLKKHSKKRGDVAGLLLHLKVVAADWMGGGEQQITPAKGKGKKGVAGAGGVEGEGSRQDNARAVPPSAAQLQCMQHLVHTMLLGSAAQGRGGFFGEKDLSAADLRDLHAFLHRLLLFAPILALQGTILELTSVGFLWFRESHLEIDKVTQFTIECSVPWILMDAVLEETNPAAQGPFLDSVLAPLGIYNDAANSALRVLSQQYLYDEIEAEVDLCFDQLVFKLGERIFAIFKARAAGMLLDKEFVAALGRSRQERLRPPVRRCEALLGQAHLQVLGREIDLHSLLTQRLNRIFRKNLDFILDRLDASDLCLAVEGQQQVEVVQACHALLAEHLALDPFPAMLAEAQQGGALTSFSARSAAYVFREVQQDLLPNFLWSTGTQRFVRIPNQMQTNVARGAAPRAKESFLYGTKELNEAYSYCAVLHSRFVGLPHVRAIVALLGPHSLPHVIQNCLDLIAQKVTHALAPHVSELLHLLPKSLSLPPFHIGFAGSMEYLQLQLAALQKHPRLGELVAALRDIGSLLAFLSLMDLALRHAESRQLQQVAPWLGVVPGGEGQLQQIPAAHEAGPAAPLSDLLQRAAAATPATRHGLMGVLQAAQVAEAMYWSGVQGESLLAHGVGYLEAALAPFRAQWAPAAPLGGLSDLDFHRLYSVIQFIRCDLDPVAGQSIGAVREEHSSDALAWGAGAIIYILGQHQKFELQDFTYQLLRVAEYEAREFPEAKPFLERSQRARRLNAHVASMMKAHLPQPLKPAHILTPQGTETTHTYPLPESEFYPGPPPSESEYHN